ncbi:uncharacterized protein TNCV_2451481 [Trichonephila clavipes]|nr:uncharacterized protein TNCV_2451481 [Trichonephila clavipes]
MPGLANITNGLLMGNTLLDLTLHFWLCWVNRLLKVWRKSMKPWILYAKTENMLCSVQQLFRVRPKVTGKPKIRDVWEISDLEGEKDSNVDHREEITDFVQSTPRFQESDDVEIWMACDAEDCEFQMLNGDEDCDFRARRVRSCRR